MLLITDLVLMSRSPQGRRVGDILAGTQVVYYDDDLHHYASHKESIDAEIKANDPVSTDRKQIPELQSEYFCGKCGADVAFGDPFCKSCGDVFEYDNPT
jgi:hypothetical protein